MKPLVLLCNFVIIDTTGCSYISIYSVFLDTILKQLASNVIFS